MANRDSTPVPHLVALATALPPHVVRQEQARAVAAVLLGEVVAQDERLLQVFEHAQIETRHICVPLSWFEEDHDFATRNGRYLEEAVRLSAEVAQGALERAELQAGDIDHLVFVSSTGIAAPSVDARLANRLGCRSDMRRTPIWGLGCAGGAAGVGRAAEFARAEPGARVLLVTIELCSLTFQRHDLSPRNLVASSLFGDGAAGAVVSTDGLRTGARHRPLEIVASASTLWPGTLDVMGWDVDGEGLHVVFSREIPALVRERARQAIESFLDARGMSLDQIDHLVAHPGGVKVMRALEEALEIGSERLCHSREVLRTCGNMSSPTCLFVLERFLEAGDIQAGDHALLTALGPGFAAESVLLRGVE
jgi:alkylresorcinol/alkylpyrone synthase